MQKNCTRLRPIQKLAVRLLRKQCFSVNQLSFAFRVDVKSIQNLQSFTSLKSVTLEELGHPSNDTGLFVAALESANSWMGSQPAIQAMLSEGPRGRGPTKTTMSIPRSARQSRSAGQTADQSSRRPVGRPRKAPKAKAA